MEISNEKREKLSKRLDLLIVESDKRLFALKKLMELGDETNINEKLKSEIDGLLRELRKIHEEGNKVVTQLKKLESN